jgi:hypothetical protein
MQTLYKTRCAEICTTEVFTVVSLAVFTGDEILVNNEKKKKKKKKKKDQNGADIS